MKLFRNGVALAAAALLVACQGSFSNGTSTPGLPPNNPTAPSPAAAANAQASPAIGGNGTYPFSQAAAGFQCPESQGFSCVLKFNIPPTTPTPQPTPSPKKSNAKNKKVKAKSTPRPTAAPTASPSPSPLPTNTASPGASASPSSSASPSGSAMPATSAASAGPNVTIKLDPLPKDAPAMNNPDPKAVATTPLLALRLSVDGDVVLNGPASADFTLPQEQIGGRGFAIQLFDETQRKHHKIDDRYLGSYSQSTVSGTTLHFTFTPPPVTVKKGETWLFVLYGDERPSASTSPAPSGSPLVLPSILPSGTMISTPTPSPAP